MSRLAVARQCTIEVAIQASFCGGPCVLLSADGTLSFFFHAKIITYRNEKFADKLMAVFTYDSIWNSIGT